MSRFGRPTFQRQPKPRPWSIHPIWRGIGCLFMILLPIMSFVASYLLLRENFRQGWVAMPENLLRSFFIPSFGTVYLADLALTLILMFLEFGILTVGYAFLYRLIGPSRYGPLDAPPSGRRRTRYKR